MSDDNREKDKQVSHAASLLGRRGKGIKKTLSPELIERKRKLMAIARDARTRRLKKMKTKQTRRKL